ncbi:MAG: hypothetical protein ACR2NO_05810 [Chloroflexota bacterium]
MAVTVAVSLGPTEGVLVAETIAVEILVPASVGLGGSVGVREGVVDGVGVRVAPVGVIVAVEVVVAVADAALPSDVGVTVSHSPRAGVWRSCALS